MSFANPQALLLIPILIAFHILFGFLYSRRQKKLAQWIDPKMWVIIIPEFSRRVFTTRFYSVAIALVFAAISLARPQWGEHEEVLRSEGMDIIVLLDLSNSMSAEDVLPSRLSRAQTFVKKLLTQLPNDRVGVVGFAESAYVAVPLTNDFGYVGEMVGTLDPGAIQNQGTNIANAIDAAIKSFERGAEDDKKTSRAVIMITDGEDFGQGAKAAAERIKDFGAGFLVVTVGLSEGAPIPIRNENGVLQTYKKDRSGKPILTRVNKDLAAEIAEAGDGKSFELVNPDDAAYTASKFLSSYSRGSTKEQKNITKIDRYQYFLAASVLFFLIHLFVGYRRPKRLWEFRARRKAAVAAATAATAIFFVVSSAQAQTLEGYLRSKKGKQLYNENDYESSAQAYDSAHNLDKDNSTLEFNEGTALAKAKRIEEAITHFQESTKKALNQGDYESAAKSLYNEGLTQHEAKNVDAAYDRLTQAIEMAKISNQPELERRAREALMQVQQDQQQQQKQNDQKKDSKDDKDSKDQPKPKDGKQDQDGKDKKNQQPNQLDTKKRDFHSGTLSKDVAEGIMNDLSDREKQLYHKRLKDQKGREAPHDKDW
ncbi:MAG: VWA domain-containing protein [Bdellovibrionales bacterium]|nr:VWA domain-containing protein [Bdellovibrionales bacterium]